MDTGYLTPLLDIFKHGQADRDIRLAAAKGELALRPDEERGLLELLMSDPDPEIAAAAAATQQAAPARPQTQDAASAESAAGEGDATEPPAAQTPEAKAERELGMVQKLAAMNPAQRLGRAMKGTREERAILIRDPNKIVAAAVLSSPKLSEAEVEAIAKMANVSEDVLRIIGNTRAWMKSYSVVVALTKNPKTPLAMSMNMLSRLHEKDVKLLMADRNVPDVLRIAARKKLAPKN